MPKLTKLQIEHALRTPATPKRNKEAFRYEAAIYDDVIVGMFGRVWLDEEVFPPRAKEIWSALFQQCLGDSIDFEDVPLVVAVAEHTKSETLRAKAVCALKLHLLDCSGTENR